MIIFRRLFRSCLSNVGVVWLINRILIKSRPWLLVCCCHGFTMEIYIWHVNFFFYWFHVHTPVGIENVVNILLSCVFGIKIWAHAFIGEDSTCYGNCQLLYCGIVFMSVWLAHVIYNLLIPVVFLILKWIS